MLMIRMARQGTKKKPQYLVVVTNKASCRDGAYLAKLGYYYPKVKDDSAKLKVDLEKIAAWKAKGAQPSESLTKLLALQAKGPSKKSA